MSLSPDQQELLDALSHDLRTVEHVSALVLGGSHSTGLATDSSDMDIGIYYHESKPFSIEAIRSIANKFSQDTAPTVTDLYGWGPWVNGGAWIHTAAGEVDLIYRNIDQLDRVIQEAKTGTWHNDYAQQPPFGFSSVTYLAETLYCIPVYDPLEILAQAKKEVAVYPLALKQAIVQETLWSAHFALWQAEKSAGKQDLFNTAACLSRALKNIIDALFALNETYSMGDKHAIRMLGKLPIVPSELASTIEFILTLDKQRITENVSLGKKLHGDVATLAGNLYRPVFDL